METLRILIIAKALAETENYLMGNFYLRNGKDAKGSNKRRYNYE